MSRNDASSEPLTPVKESLKLSEANFTPTEDLMLEALIARLRLGEHIWTFDSKHRKTAENLAKKGWVGWKHGIVENSIMVWPANEEIRSELVKYDYKAPILKDYISKKKVAKRYILIEDAEIAILKAKKKRNK
jgi:hypothetical protein